MEHNPMVMLAPIVSTLAYLMRNPEFTWTNAIPYIFPMLLPLLANMTMPQVCIDIYNWCRDHLYSRNIRSFTARLELRRWVNEPESVVRNFSILLWEWNRLDMTVNCKSLMEEVVATRYFDHNSETDRGCALFVDDRITPFWNKNNSSIHYYMWMDRNVDREGLHHPEVFLRMEFHNAKCVPNDIVRHIEYIRGEAQRISAARMLKQRVLVSTENTSSNSTQQQFMIYEFATTSSFQNFFSEESATVEKDLDHFLKNKEEYERTGKPWTYTVLNEGPPGVGKTKLVKAIAAKTGYTLIIINLAHIQTIHKLYDAFHSPYLNGEHVPHNKRIYYIPEVDTQMIDVLQARKPPTQDSTSQLATFKDPLKSTTDSTKKPTLGEILNILDGVPERHGHILIMDTNHLAKLDPALVRPGRVDRIVSWGKMSAQSVRSYIEHYYKVSLPKTVVLPDRVVTAAELQSYVSRETEWTTLVATLLPSAVKQDIRGRARRN